MTKMSEFLLKFVVMVIAMYDCSELVELIFEFVVGRTAWPRKVLLIVRSVITQS